MSKLPDTTTPNKPRRTLVPAAMILVSTVLLAAVLFVVLVAGEDEFAPGEEIYVPEIGDIAAGTGEAPFPRHDASRFAAGTEAVRVYLRVEDLPQSLRMAAAVERSARSSAVFRFFGEEVRAVGGGEERLSVSENGASGVVAFEVRAGESLPAGRYTVEVRAVGENGGGAGAVLARKYFVVGDPQT